MAEENKNPIISKFWERVKKYQRPARSVVWVVCIVFAFVGCLTGCFGCEENKMVTGILTAMFFDLGIYTMARTKEKIS